MIAHPPRTVVWFSCGATSAVAAMLTLRDTPNASVVYCDTGSEHPDNQRFLKDVEKWLGCTVEVIRSEKFRSIWDVFERTRYLAGIRGARCTVELKKVPRMAYQRVDDVQVFGYDADEVKRVEQFRMVNPEIDLRTPLLDRGLTKPDCLAMLKRAGIEPPAMYALGFTNANCVGCPKGGAGYWNKIRRHFPDVFDRMAKVERELNAAICKSYAGDGKRKRVFLNELDPDAGRDDEVSPECGLLCWAAEQQGEAAR